MSNYWILDPFYEFMDDYLNHDRHCPCCNEKLWVCYGSGHIWDKCLACSCPAITVEQLADSSIFYLAGYITFYQEPKQPPPDTFEVRDYDGGKVPDYRENHERAYRKNDSL